MTDGDHFHSKINAAFRQGRREGLMTQKEMILAYMRETGSITAAEAMSEIGCYRLAARISDIKRDGIYVRSDKAKSVNRFGKKVTYSRYMLA